MMTKREKKIVSESKCLAFSKCAPWKRFYKDKEDFTQDVLLLLCEEAIRISKGGTENAAMTISRVIEGRLVEKMIQDEVFAGVHIPRSVMRKVFSGEYHDDATEYAKTLLGIETIE